MTTDMNVKNEQVKSDSSVTEEKITPTSDDRNCSDYRDAIMQRFLKRV